MPQFVAQGPMALPLVAPYTGPGDILSFFAWWGLRAYSQATVSTAALDIVDTSGANQTTINTLATGLLDETAISNFVASFGTACAKQYYDKVSTRHFLQATAANMPRIAQSALNTHSALSAVKASSQQMRVSGNTTSITGPWTMYMVAIHPSGSTGDIYFGYDNTSAANGESIQGFNVDPNWTTFGSALTHASWDHWHTILNMKNGASSQWYVDGSLVDSPNEGTTDISNPSDLILFNDRFNGFGTGKIVEIGIMTGNQSASAAALASNVATYYGALP